MGDGTGRWEGWLEFVPASAGRAVRTGQETTQPNVADLRYWATGLTRAYLEGALRRALSPAPAPPDRTVDATPAYPGPAPHRTGVRPSRRERRSRAVLDPFAVYAQGENVLRQELSALDAAHLRGIIEVYGLASERTPDLRAMGEVALVDLIVKAVRSVVDDVTTGRRDVEGPAAAT